MVIVLMMRMNMIWDFKNTTTKFIYNNYFVKI